MEWTEGTRAASEALGQTAQANCLGERDVGKAAGTGHVL